MGWRLPSLADPLHRNAISRTKRFHRKPLRRILGAENSSVPSHKANSPDATRISNRMKESIIPKAMANKCETKPSSKPSVKGWMRRVLRKENNPSKPDRGSTLFRKRNRTRKTKRNVTDGPSSPMNTRTTADETSSQYCNSRTEEGPHRTLLTVQTNEAYRCSNYSSSDMCEEQKDQMIEAEGRGSDLPLTPIPSDAKGEESVEKNELPKFTFQKSEIIAKLFPMGYPSSQKTENDSHREITIDFLATDDDEDIAEHIDVPAVTSLFPMGHPDSRQKKESKNNSARSKSTSRKSKNHECDKFIGAVISFDPTWDLLTPEPEEATTMVKSRLKKFYEIENYADSILGKFAGEDSSEESMELLEGVNLSFGSEPVAFLPYSKFKAEEKSSFELGYHFDPKRFPDVDTSEVEICFYLDEASIECHETSSATEKYNTSGAAEKTAVFREQFEFLSDSEDSGDGVHIDDADSICNSDGGKVFLNDSLDCIDSQSIRRSPINPFVTPSKLHSLSFLSSPQQTFSPNNVFLFMDKDENDQTECESSSTTSTQITPIELQPIKSLCLPKFGSPRLSTPVRSKTSPRREIRDLRF